MASSKRTVYGPAALPYFNSFFSEVVSLAAVVVSAAVDQPYKSDQDENGGKHQREVKGLVSIGQSDVSDTAASDVTGHGGGSDQCDGSGGQRQDDGSKCLRQYEMNDDLECIGPHGLRRLDDSGIDVKQGVFQQSC